MVPLCTCTVASDGLMFRFSFQVKVKMIVCNVYILGWGYSLIKVVCVLVCELPHL